MQQFLIYRCFCNVYKNRVKLHMPNTLALYRWRADQLTEQQEEGQAGRQAGRQAARLDEELLFSDRRTT